MIKRNDPCWCGSGKKWKKCHYPLKGGLPKNSAAAIKKEYYKKYQIIIKDDRQIEGIRQSCQLAAQILVKTCEMAKKGIATEELNHYAHKLHEEAGAIPAPLHYGHPPFPKSICTSLNEVICHGIPDQRPLQEGDILNIDVTCILNGYFGDCSRMVTIDPIDAEKQHVVDVSYESLMRAIAILKPGALVSAIGDAIESYASANGCSVVNQFVAHGVGVKFHEGPQIFHCYNNVDIVLQPGMTFTIEPMINEGVREAVIDPDDQWTARTQDGKASAQWEHTLLITDTGYEILTPWTLGV
ncbi:MAG: methionyl aminopeptidase [Waddliaceae bacterium]